MPDCEISSTTIRWWQIRFVYRKSIKRTFIDASVLEKIKRKLIFSLEKKKVTLLEMVVPNQLLTIKRANRKQFISVFGYPLPHLPHSKTNKVRRSRFTSWIDGGRLAQKRYSKIGSERKRSEVEQSCLKSKEGAKASPFISKGSLKALADWVYWNCIVTFFQIDFAKLSLTYFFILNRL